MDHDRPISTPSSPAVDETEPQEEAASVDTDTTDTADETDWTDNTDTTPAADEPDGGGTETGGGGAVDTNDQDETPLTGGGAAGSSGGPYLILAPDNNNNAGILLANRDKFAASPFDGVTVNTTAMWVMANQGYVSYEDIMSDVGSLRGYPKMKNSFLVILVAGAGTQPDPYDDWSRYIQGWVNFARAAKELGMAGVVFDNEPYVGTSPWNFPGGVKYAGRYSEEEYRNQVRRRGKETMEAMRKVFPDIKVLVYHGPYISEPSFYESDLKAQSDLSPLNGSFTAGLLEGAGEQAMVIDGGEVYANRSEEDFRDFYNFRKYTMASDENDSPVVVPSLRKVWSKRLSVSNGLYNLSWSASMSPEIMRTTVANAMKYSDDYVWIYTEEVNWMADLPSAWAEAIAAGKEAGLRARRNQ
ncbi:MAG TPA: hypothetical protein ENJ77_00310 [Candidatus Moranbacteria bacterium]|nr:hypothetical protein [Candidatus Moranbacteria bacterium]